MIVYKHNSEIYNNKTLYAEPIQNNRELRDITKFYFKLLLNEYLT